MMNKILIAAGASILLVALTYMGYFYFHLGYSLSSKPSDWAELGDYFGGILNPILGFTSVVLLIQSLNMQYQANHQLKKEIQENEKTERYRIFETLFFSLIESQREMYKSFKIMSTEPNENTNTEHTKTQAVLFIEDTIEQMREAGLNTEEIGEALEEMDHSDDIFGIIRGFYVTVKIINDRLDDKNGFVKEDRKTHINTLLNLMDFGHIRLVIICIQFFEYPSCIYLRNNDEFNSLAKEIGLELGQY